MFLVITVHVLVIRQQGLLQPLVSIGILFV